MVRLNLGTIIGLILMSFILSSCGIKSEQEFATIDPRDPGNVSSDKQLERDAADRGTVWGDGGILGLFGFGDEGKKKETGGPAIGVNAFLWRATLDTISFMPLSSADPFGGVIITDWYTPPETPNERLKVTAYILSRQLRADGLRISVFRERLNGGIWRTEKTAQDTAIKLENKVLERARQIRIASKKKY
ncbi:MAG: DUF3576 domain-containing protein [Rhodospirillaceae bacterium]|jgi:hypothetical protein